jgi:hypothetical protein
VLIPLDRLLMPPNMPAGMDWAVIGLWVAKFRKTPQPCDPPILVTAEGRYWRIRDGRHRVTAALISGRTYIEAEEADMMEHPH